MRKSWYALAINPEPWAVGTVTPTKGKGARISPNPNLQTFQQAVKEELAAQVPFKFGPQEGFLKVRFYFWRQTAKYLDTNDRVRQRNIADATNLQKGLEDALQGVLFENDRDVRDIRSVIVEQGTAVKPLIIIGVDLLSHIYHDNTLGEIPTEVLQEGMQLSEGGKQSDNNWIIDEDPF